MEEVIEKMADQDNFDNFLPIPDGEDVSDDITGYIDNLSIFDVTKSDDEITTIYNAGKPKDMTQGFAGLIAYYVMNEGSGTTVSDDSTNNNDMTLVHAPAWTTDVP